jgi:hypothetical protein
LPLALRFRVFAWLTAYPLALPVPRLGLLLVPLLIHPHPRLRLDS